jgi:hypothetical protein
LPEDDIAGCVTAKRFASSKLFGFSILSDTSANIVNEFPDWATVLDAHFCRQRKYLHDYRRPVSNA